MSQDDLATIFRHAMEACAPLASGRFAQVVDFRDGRVVRGRLYGGVASALEAVGPRE